MIDYVNLLRPAWSRPESSVLHFSLAPIPYHMICSFPVTTISIEWLITVLKELVFLRNFGYAIRLLSLHMSEHLSAMESVVHVNGSESHLYWQHRQVLTRQSFLTL